MNTCAQLTMLKQEFEEQLLNIASWWINYAPDLVHGGFFGEIDINNQPNINADKSAVLITRILWFFSALAIKTSDSEHTSMAHSAYSYLSACFLDKKHGGIFWNIDHKGTPKYRKKHIYTQSFAIYAYSTYYQLTQKNEAIDNAIKIQDLVEKHAWDNQWGGYIDAFTEQWKYLDDTRLNVDDQNYRKKMNTHLHILEAYTRVYQAKPSPSTRKALKRILQCYCHHFIDQSNHQLILYANESWQSYTPYDSPGHGIESCWLINEALESLNDCAFNVCFSSLPISLYEHYLQSGFDALGGFKDHLNSDGTFSTKRIWWAQAEALTGFLDAYCTTGKAHYFDAFTTIWQFIKHNQIDQEKGEWYWYSKLDNNYRNTCKASAWKGPYHNGRAMLEVIKRIDSLAMSHS